jgi:hypothetical protein
MYRIGGVIVALGICPLAEIHGVIVTESETLPEKRLNVLTEIVEAADSPVITGRGLGFAESEKSEEVLESRQAVSGCSSHPEKLWAASFRWSGSQDTNP